MTAALLPWREWWRRTPSLPTKPVTVAHSRRSPLAFWALMYFMFSLLIAPQSFVPGLGALHLAAVAVTLAITSHVVTALRHGQSVFGSHVSILWAGALAGWALLTAPFSYWPGGTVSLLFELYFKSLVIFWLLSVVIDTRTRLKRFVTWITLLTVPIGATAIAHFLSGAYVEGGDRTAPRIMGYEAPLTANPNDLALVLCMMLPLAVALAVGERSTLGRLTFAAIACLDVIAVVITYSRTGIVTLAALACGALFKLSRSSARVWAAVIVAVGLGLVPLLPAGYMQHMGTITAIETDPTGSAQSRWSDTLTAAHIVLANPIVGAGAGMSALALNEARGPAWLPVHNVYLEYATDLGLPGLALFLLMLGSCFHKSVQTARSMANAGADWDLRCIAQGIQMMLIAFVVAGFFHPVAYHFHFYYAGGLAASLAVVWENAHA